MWNVKNGRLRWGLEPVAVRRVVVEMVAGRRAREVTEEQARRMIRMERALSLRALRASLGTGTDP